ncbi:MAG: hypothetical protein M0Q13_01325 [Methanothrix sp.]|nr:hypothetical protein [Methanothrix sp.]
MSCLPGFSQPFPKLKRSPAVLREDGPVPLLPFLRVDITEYHLFVILKLEYARHKSL